MPRLSGIHHLKFAVHDLDQAERFYERVFDARRISEADHRDAAGRLYAVVCSVPGLGPLLELRLDPAAAERHAGFDPVTIAVADLAELDTWAHRLEGLGIAHSGRLIGIQAWLIAFDDPDGHRLRLYTLEQHGPDIPPTPDSPWLPVGA